MTISTLISFFYHDLTFLPWYHFTAVVQHFLPWYCIIFLPWWNIFYLDIILLPWCNIFFLDIIRDMAFSTLISFDYRDGTFSSLISFYYRDGTFSTPRYHFTAMMKNIFFNPDMRNAKYVINRKGVKCVSPKIKHCT